MTPPRLSGAKDELHEGYSSSWLVHIFEDIGSRKMSWIVLIRLALGCMICDVIHETRVDGKYYIIIRILVHNKPRIHDA